MTHYVPNGLDLKCAHFACFERTLVVHSFEDGADMVIILFLACDRLA
jgi:hypothetical protein